MSTQTHPGRVTRGPRFRLSIVAIGAVLIVSCAVILFGGPWWVFSAMPEVGPANGRVALVVPGAPLTIVGILVAGARWTRKWRASTRECIGTLVLMQLIAAAFIVGLGAGSLLDIEFFVGVSNLLFAPWWFLGHMIGVAWDGPRRGRSRFNRGP